MPDSPVDSDRPKRPDSCDGDCGDNGIYCCDGSWKSDRPSGPLPGHGPACGEDACLTCYLEGERDGLAATVAHLREANRRVRAENEALKAHNPLTCELCHAEGFGGELASLKAENLALKERVALFEVEFSEYAEHQSWRCEHRESNFYLVEPHGPDCPCGLDETRRELGLASTTKEASDG